MRRPQTKTPYAYYRHGTRNRGRPVHRIYAATPRPPMHGYWAYITVGGDPTYICFSTDQNFWWARPFATLAEWDDLKLSVTHGGVWNADLWAVTTLTTAMWDSLVLHPDEQQKGAWGSQFPPHMPWTLLDNFSV